jgi:hypothetical protein
MRDLDNGRPIKDLDVFYNEAHAADNFISALSGRYVYKNGITDCSYIDAASEIFSTTVFIDTQGGPDLNLINVDPSFDTTKMLERMDFGICLIGFNGEEVIRTKAYHHDQANQQFTLTRADSIEGTLRSLKRYDRLAQKYPEWPLVIPQELQEVGYEAMRRHMADIAVVEEFKQVLAVMEDHRNCPMCDGTGYKDHAGFCMDPCDHQTAAH